MSSLHDLRDHLLAVRESRGSLTPAIVVEEASEPDHPLHSRFQWDDASAAHAFRLEQARSLIRSARIVYREGDKRSGPRSVRAFHSLPTPDGRVYEPSEDIAADPLMRQMLLQDMEREWKELRDRYKHFAEFADMVLADMQTAAA